MELSGLRLGRRSALELDALLASACDAELTYAEQGCTLRDGSVPGLEDRTFTHEVAGDLTTATEALHRWATHAGIGARIHPAGAEPIEGTSLLVVAPFGPIEMAVPVRVVAVIAEPRRSGFAYGTLPGHAETGEELFVAEQVGPGNLRLGIRVLARPGTATARLATPLVRLLQGAAARRYLAAWASAVAGTAGRAT